MEKFATKAFERVEVSEQSAITDKCIEVPKLARLRSFIESESFICQLGSGASKSGRIAYCELSSSKSCGSQLTPVLNSFLKKESDAIIITPALEPIDHTALVQSAEDIVSAVILKSVFCQKDLNAEVAMIKRTLPYLKEDYVPAILNKTNEDIGIDYRQFIKFYFQGLAAKVYQGNDLSRLDVVKSLNEFAKVLVKNIPRLSLVVGDRGPMVIIAMSPQYHADYAYPEEKPPILQEYSIPHGRYAPVTCIAISWLSDVNQARSNLREGGGAAWVTSRNTTAGTLAYNLFAASGHDYEPRMIVNHSYRINPELAHAIGRIKTKFSGLPEFHSGFSAFVDEMQAMKVQRSENGLKKYSALFPK